MAVSDARSPHPADHPGPFVLVDDLDAPALREADLHHLTRVLRLRAGDPVVLGDGAGSWRPGALGDQVDPTGPIEAVPPPVPSIAVGFALVKGGKPELVVQKLTELGVDRIVVLRSERSVVRWEGEKASRQLDRLRRVAREAAMQCRRCHLPELDGVLDIADVASRADTVRADRGGRPLRRADTTVVVGPEGGFTDDERAQLPDSVALGDHVLRAETAAVTAGALMTALRGGMAAESTKSTADCD